MRRGLMAALAVSTVICAAGFMATVALFAAGASSLFGQSLHLYILPEGFTGEMEIAFGLPDAPPLAREDGAYVYVVPESGKLRTSTPFESGEVRFYYADKAGGRRQIGMGDGFVHGGGTFSSSHYSSDGRRFDSPIYVRFFIGSLQQYEAHVERQSPPYEPDATSAPLSR